MPHGRDSSTHQVTSWGGWKAILATTSVPCIVHRFAAAEAFEAQTFSNVFRFPMVFLCGLFFPVERLPVFLRPLSYALPVTYGVDILHGAIRAEQVMSLAVDFSVLGAFCRLPSG